MRSALAPRSSAGAPPFSARDSLLRPSELASAYWPTNVGAFFRKITATLEPTAWNWRPDPGIDVDLFVMAASSSCSRRAHPGDWLLCPSARTRPSSLTGDKRASAAPPKRTTIHCPIRRRTTSAASAVCSGLNLLRYRLTRTGGSPTITETGRIISNQPYAYE